MALWGMEFLEAVKKTTGGEIIDESGRGSRRDTEFRPFPRLMADYKKHYVKVDFIDYDRLLIEVNVTPPHRLLLLPETFVSKTLDKFGLSAEVKIGVDDFDSKYLIQYAEAELAKKTLDAKFREIFNKLEPVFEFELTDKEFRLIKLVDIEKDYSPKSALADLETMIEISDHVVGMNK